MSKKCRLDRLRYFLSYRRFSVCPTNEFFKKFMLQFCSVAIILAIMNSNDENNGASALFAKIVLFARTSTCTVTARPKALHSKYCINNIDNTFVVNIGAAPCARIPYREGYVCHNSQSICSRSCSDAESALADLYPNDKNGNIVQYLLVDYQIRHISAKLILYSA